jgi:hypothetical protein
MLGCQPCAPVDGVLIVSVRVLEYLCCLCGQHVACYTIYIYEYIYTYNIYIYIQYMLKVKPISLLSWTLRHEDVWGNGGKDPLFWPLQ